MLLSSFSDDVQLSKFITQKRLGIDLQQTTKQVVSKALAPKGSES